MTTNEELHARVEGLTIPKAFLATIAEQGEAVALRWKAADDSWHEWTYNDFAAKVASVVTGLTDMGVGKGDRVVLMMANRPEFHVADLAALFCGATPVSIYNSSASEQVAYLAGHCKAKVAIAGNADFLARFEEVRGELPTLESMVLIDGDAPDGVTSWETLTGAAAADLTAAAEVGDPSDLATVIYTSGTTGPPKGVMIDHVNVAWTVESLKEAIEAEIEIDTFAGKRIISYLPMAHIAERMVSHYQMLFMGYEVTTCPDPTLIAAYAGEVRPHLLFGVPRVWEKVYAGVNAVLAADPEKQQKFNEAIEAAIPIIEAKSWGTATQEQLDTWDFLDAVAFQQVRELIGMDQLLTAITGAAPIPAEMLSWFRAIGIPLSEIYGMSENCGPMTWSAGKVKAGSVGPAMPGCEVALAEEDNEIICRGGNVFRGYLDDAEKTNEAMDTDGWLHSGDIGELDDDGYFKIVDRKKELIVTAGGKNLSPSNLESALKMIPLVGQAMAIGDRRKFVSALVVLEPDAAAAWAAANDVDGSDLEALAQNPDLCAEIDTAVAEVMAPFNNTEKVKKVKVLGTEWMPDTDLLTPTSKLKRRGITAAFEAEIESIYA